MSRDVKKALEIALNAQRPERVHHTLARTGYAAGGLSSPMDISNDAPYTEKSVMSSPKGVTSSPMDIATMTPYSAKGIDLPAGDKIAAPKGGMKMKGLKPAKVRVRKPRVVKPHKVRFDKGGSAPMSDALKIAAKAMTDLDKDMPADGGVSSSQGSSSVVVKKKEPGERAQTIYEKHEQTPPMRFSYGPRHGSSALKDIGFYGPISTGGRDVASEYSMDDDIGQYPSVAADMPERLKTQALNAARFHANVPREAADFAYDKARERLGQGRSPFYEPGRDPYPAWSPDQNWEKPYGLHEDVRTRRAMGGSMHEDVKNALRLANRRHYDDGGVATPLTAGANPASAPDNSDFLNQLYQSSFGRAPDQGGLDFWSQQMQNGLSQEDVRKRFAASQEAAAHQGGGNNGTNGTPGVQTPNYTGFVNDLYQSNFNRAADQGGLDFWTQQMQNGVSAQDVARNFASSGEAKNYTQNGQQLPSKFVDTYSELTPLAEKYNIPNYYAPANVSGSFLPQLDPSNPTAQPSTPNTGGTPTTPGGDKTPTTPTISDILSGKATVDPSKYGDFVTSLYTEGLKRQPDVSGQQYWSGLLAKGEVTPQQVIQAFGASPEAQIAGGYKSPTEFTGDRSVWDYFHPTLTSPTTPGGEGTPTTPGGGTNVVTDTTPSDPKTTYKLPSDFGSNAQNFLPVLDQIQQQTLDPSDYSKFISGLYQQGLGRDPDVGGYNFMVGLLGSGQATPGDVANLLLSSPESQANQVGSLYQYILGRDADQGGLQYWQDQISQGKADLNDVAESLMSGPEYQNYLDQSFEADKSGYHLANPYEFAATTLKDGTGKTGDYAVGYLDPNVWMSGENNDVLPTSFASSILKGGVGADQQIPAGYIDPNVMLAAGNNVADKYQFAANALKNGLGENGVYKPYIDASINAQKVNDLIGNMDPSKPDNFVSGLYNTLAGKAGDAATVADLSKQLTAGTITPVQAAQKVAKEVNVPLPPRRSDSFSTGATPSPAEGPTTAEGIVTGAKNLVTGAFDKLKSVASSVAERAAQALHPTAQADPKYDYEKRVAIEREAQKLGVDPEDLAKVMLFESIGSLNPSRKGVVDDRPGARQAVKQGANPRFMGLIQFGAQEQRKYNIRPDMSFDEQMTAVGKFLSDRGLSKWLKDHPNATNEEKRTALYSTINAGGPGQENWGKTDAGHGGSRTTVRQKSAQLEKDWGNRARAILASDPSTSGNAPLPPARPGDLDNLQGVTPGGEPTPTTPSFDNGGGMSPISPVNPYGGVEFGPDAGTNTGSGQGVSPGDSGTSAPGDKGAGLQGDGSGMVPIYKTVTVPGTTVHPMIADGKVVPGTGYTAPATTKTVIAGYEPQWQASGFHSQSDYADAASGGFANAGSYYAHSSSGIGGDIFAGIGDALDGIGDFFGGNTGTAYSDPNQWYYDNHMSFVPGVGWIHDSQSWFLDPAYDRKNGGIVKRARSAIKVDDDDVKAALRIAKKTRRK